VKREQLQALFAKEVEALYTAQRTAKLQDAIAIE